MELKSHKMDYRALRFCDAITSSTEQGKNTSNEYTKHSHSSSCKLENRETEWVV